MLCGFFFFFSIWEEMWLCLSSMQLGNTCVQLHYDTHKFCVSLCHRNCQVLCGTLTCQLFQALEEHSVVFQDELIDEFTNIVDVVLKITAKFF